MIYAIGDVHGYSDELKRAHDRIAADKARSGAHTAEVVHLGDLTDRGPDSKGVIDFILAGIDAGEPWRVIKGNHDRFFGCKKTEDRAAHRLPFGSGECGEVRAAAATAGEI